MLVILDFGHWKKELELLIFKMQNSSGFILMISLVAWPFKYFFHIFQYEHLNNIKFTWALLTDSKTVSIALLSKILPTITIRTNTETSAVILPNCSTVNLAQLLYIMLWLKGICQICHMFQKLQSFQICMLFFCSIEHNLVMFALNFLTD